MTEEKRPLGSFSISATESLKFAAISGDYNPLHVDPDIAKRSQFGDTLIHGVHGTLCALERYFQQQTQALSLSSVQVTFNKPALHGDDIECLVAKETSESARIELQCQGEKVQVIKLRYAPQPQPVAGAEPISLLSANASPKASQVSIEEADGLSGSNRLIWDPVEFARIFPDLVTLIPDSQCATFLGTSKIVGMDCPGMNAIYTRLDLSFDCDAVGSASPLHYNVVSADSRFARIVIALKNAIAVGEIEAFIRPSPVE